MPKAKRERRERTDNYHRLLEWCRTPEQRLYEGIRPITLFGVPPAERAQETGLAESSLRRAADAFDTQGMISLFRPTKAQREDHHRSLPVLMRQLIVDLKAEYPDFTLGEIAAICAIQFAGRRPTGTLLTRVRKSYRGRVASPGKAHQVIAEVGEVGAVQTTPANTAAA